MSFVINTTNEPFSIVAQNPTADQLDAAIRAGIDPSQPGGSKYTNAAPGDLLVNPDQTVIVGGDDQTAEVISNSSPSSILVTGLGTRIDFDGPANIQLTNLGGAGIIAENIDPSEDLSVQTVGISSAYASVNNNIDEFAEVAGNTGGEIVSIQEAGSGLTGDINFYVHAGAGDDLLVGSDINDFIRGGAGDDKIDARGGNDLVRGGAGSDTICLGAGSDTLLYTVDQLQPYTSSGVVDEDVILDFNADGTEFDKIVVDTDGGNGFAELIDQDTVRIVVENQAGQQIAVQVTTEDDFIDPLGIEFI